MVRVLCICLLILFLRKIWFRGLKSGKSCRRMAWGRKSLKIPIENVLPIHSIDWLLASLCYHQKINSSRVLHQSWRTPGQHEVPGCLAWQDRDFSGSFLHLLEPGGDGGLPFWKIASRIRVWGTSCFSVTQERGTSQDFNYSWYFTFPFLLFWNSTAAWNFSSTLMPILFPPVSSWSRTMELNQHWTIWNKLWLPVCFAESLQAVTWENCKFGTDVDSPSLLSESCLNGFSNKQVNVVTCNT